MSRQKLGQHFLSSPAILERIAGAACLPDEPLVIEIGPGKGALTKHLRKRARQVVAIELDPQLAATLRATYSADPQVKVIQADAREIDLRQWGPAVLAGNLPYYAATPIMERAVRQGPAISQSVFLIQKEVAERVTAQPETKAYGYLTILLAIYADTQLLFEVKPGAFRPPPKVDSAAVKLTWHPKASALGITDPEHFLSFVSACFRHKRKTIRNNLGLNGGLPPEASRRAEQLALSQFAQLYRQVYHNRGGNQ